MLFGHCYCTEYREIQLKFILKTIFFLSFPFSFVPYNMHLMSNKIFQLYDSVNKTIIHIENNYFNGDMGFNVLNRFSFLLSFHFLKWFLFLFIVHLTLRLYLRTNGGFFITLFSWNIFIFMILFILIYTAMSSAQSPERIFNTIWMIK